MNLFDFEQYVTADKMVTDEQEGAMMTVWEFKTEHEYGEPLRCCGCDRDTDIVFFPNVGDPDGLCAECSHSCVDCGDKATITWVDGRGMVCPVCFSARLTSDIYKEG